MVSEIEDANERATTNRNDDDDKCVAAVGLFRTTTTPQESRLVGTADEEEDDDGRISLRQADEDKRTVGVSIIVSLKCFACTSC